MQFRQRYPEPSRESAIPDEAREELVLRGAQADGEPDSVVGTIPVGRELDRHWIALELHDGLVQDATGALMELEGVLASEALPQGRMRDQVRRAAEHIRAAIDGARRLIGGLRSPELDELGLVGAVEHLVAHQRTGDPVIDLVVEGPCQRFDATVEAEAFRIVQEAIQNLRRHSRSDRGMVRLGCQDGWLRMEICDWGIGFDPATVAPSRFGLAGIRERSRRLQGHATVDSGPGLGTRIRVELPLSVPPRPANSDT